MNDQNLLTHPPKPKKQRTKKQSSNIKKTHPRDFNVKVLLTADQRKGLADLQAITDLSYQEMISRAIDYYIGRFNDAW